MVHDLDNSPVCRPQGPGTLGLEEDDEIPPVYLSSRGTTPKTPSRRDQGWDEADTLQISKERPAWKTSLYDKTLEYIMNEAVFTFALVRQEVEWFFWGLGLDDFYFKATDFQDIASHIQSLYAAKILASVSGSQFDIKLRQETPEGGFYCCQALHQYAVRTERRIEQMYLEEGYTSNQTSYNKGMFPLEQYGSMRMACYRSQGSIGQQTKKRLSVYFLEKAKFDDPEPVEGEFDVNVIGNDAFLRTASDRTKSIYQDVLREAVDKVRPVVRTYDCANPDEECRLVVCYKKRSTHSFLSGTSDLLRSFNLFSTRKYVEPFRNGYVIYSIYVKRLDPSSEPIDRDRLVDTVHLVYALPRTSLTPLFQDGTLTIQEMAYAYCAWKFSMLFQQSKSPEFQTLLSAVKHQAPQLVGTVSRLRERVQGESQAGGRMRESILNHPKLLKILYADFMSHHSRQAPGGVRPFDREHGQELLSQIKRNARTEYDQSVFETFLLFNRHILKTNFFSTEKVCLAFRIDPLFLKAADFAELPFGIFFLVGSEFRGFHVRFRDVARGGIRIIRSPNQQAFVNNSTSLFSENYNLAFTQQRKNKDIPEGGSKGTILLDFDHQNKAETAFHKYVDGLLQLMLPGPDIVDHYGKREILFLGPDEGTADVMDWASNYARSRGADFWKGFTTGKSLGMGGIPHDLYGMTTRSVHQYVLGILRKLKVDEADCSKFQTGGPDGDLGSNEIKISSDKTIAVVDGSGVLYDPVGIDRPELERLAKARIPCSNFDRSKISEGGFLVTVDDTDLTLPDGTEVERGLLFRNTFHLSKYATADLFVPCGGRPNAVNGGNVAELFDKDRPKFKYVVEGANLFFTQDARLTLEKAGVVLIKDASANKGGVTSSSLEVLASLALTDEEHSMHMCVKEDGIVPPFRKLYVQEVIDRIEGNAAKEFETMWEAHLTTGTPLSLLTDKLSNKINAITDGIGRSKLWENNVLRRDVLKQAIPSTLINLVGFDSVLTRIPENYARAIFDAFLASSYVYACGLQAAEFEFLEFITSNFRTQA
eukprot:Rmarinus@m.21215